MLRTSIAALLLLGISVASVTAQQGFGPARGGVVQGFDRGAIAFGRNGIAGSGLTGPQFNPGGNLFGGYGQPGFRGSRGVPPFGIWGGFGGGFLSPGGYYSPEWFSYNSSLANMQSNPPPLPFFPEEPRVELSNQFPATLTVQLPAAGNVWANGNKSEGKPETEWTLTSPILPVGQEFQFDVKARWMVDGKTFEYNRTIPVVSGDRSKVLVLAGDEVK